MGGVGGTGGHADGILNYIAPVEVLLFGGATANNAGSYGYPGIVVIKYMWS